MCPRCVQDEVEEQHQNSIVDNLIIISSFPLLTPRSIGLRHILCQSQQGMMRDGVTSDTTTAAATTTATVAAAVALALTPAETYQIDSDEYDSDDDGSQMGDDEYDRLVEEGQL